MKMISTKIKSNFYSGHLRSFVDIWRTQLAIKTAQSHYDTINFLQHTINFPYLTREGEIWAFLWVKSMMKFLLLQLSDWAQYRVMIPSSWPALWSSDSL